MASVDDRSGAETGRALLASASPSAGVVHAAYFAAQAVVGVLLWVVVTESPTAREWVELSADRPAVTDSFLLPDLVVIATSTAAAWSVWMRRRSAVLWCALTTGGILYPTFYLVAWVRAHDTGAVPLALMVVASAGSLWALVGVWRSARDRDDGGHSSGMASHH